MHSVHPLLFPALLASALTWACDDALPDAERPTACLEGGVFEMGTDDLDPCGRFTDQLAVCTASEISATPWHEVFLTPFRIDVTEVTNLEYRRCVEEGPCTELSSLTAGPADDLTESIRFYGTSNFYRAYPVVNVSHTQATTYCDWVGGRLPTEAEWEFAARRAGGTRAQTWPWSETADPAEACAAEPAAVAFGACGERKPRPVGTATVDRRLGVFDLGANAAEWVLDAWDPLAYCDGDSRAEYRAATSSATFPIRRSPDAIDALCEATPGCLATCDDARLGCLASCEACRQREGAEHVDCFRQDLCGNRCALPSACDCGADPIEPACEGACACTSSCLLESPAVPDGASECVEHCYLTSEAECRASGCMDGACRTFCGEITHESVRSCRVRRSGDGPVEVPAVLEHPEGLDGLFVVKGGHYAMTAEDRCEMRVAARRPGRGASGSAYVGFRCAFDLDPGVTCGD
jgi:formylglycine-generating enzyme required for sulfatase activity